MVCCNLIGRQLLEMHRKSTQRWGWQFTIHEQPSRIQVLLSQAPVIADEVLDTEHLLEFVHNLETTMGSQFTRPKAILRYQLLNPSGPL
jgi:hypothetical protein